MSGNESLSNSSREVCGAYEKIFRVVLEEWSYKNRVTKRILKKELEEAAEYNVSEEVINIIFQLVEEAVWAILTQGVFKATGDSCPIHNERNWLWFIT